jgi:heat shock protein HslJ
MTQKISIMKKPIVLFALCLLFISCENGQKPEIAGTYYGITPCADCPGIYYELHLNEDMTYSDKWLYLESDVDTMNSNGKYEIQSDSIVILKGNEESFFERLKIRDGEMLVLDKDGNEISGELAEFYVLKTTPPEMPENSMGGKKSMFKATGTEPFWSVEIIPNGQITFKPMDGKEIVFPVPEPKMIENGESFSASGNGEMLKVEIFNESCQNDMSGEYFSHRVSVTFKTAEMENPQTWKGCGEYPNSGNLEEVADKVNGNWTLLQINGEPLPENPNYKTPTMKIVLMEGVVSGNAGCNGYSGQIKHLEGNKLSVSRVISTKMACPGLDIENKFLAVFSGKPIEFERKENLLILRNEETELIFE